MAIDFRFATDVLNTRGKVRVVTSLELYARVPDSSGHYHSVPVGMAQSMNVDETRNVDYNFVIGNTNPSRARDLIPGPVHQSTINLQMVSLYQVNGIGLFSEVPHDGIAFAPAVPYNTRPFDITERWINPTTRHTLYELTYTGCYIESASTPKSIDGNQPIKVVETLKVHFKDIVFSTDGYSLKEDVAGGTLGNPFSDQV